MLLLRPGRVETAKPVSSYLPIVAVCALSRGPDEHVYSGTVVVPIFSADSGLAGSVDVAGIALAGNQSYGAIPGTGVATVWSLLSDPT